MTIKSTKSISNQTPGLNPVYQANTAEEMAIVLTPLIRKRCNLSKSVTKKLKVQIRLYFQAIGAANKSCLGMVTESSSWAVLESIATDNQSLDQLTVPVLLLLTKLATYSVQLRKESLNLFTGVLFNTMTTWYDKYMKRS